LAISGLFILESMMSAISQQRTLATHQNHHIGTLRCLRVEAAHGIKNRHWAKTSPHW